MVEENERSAEPQFQRINSLIEVVRDLHYKGFYTFTPVDDHGPVDLIAMGPPPKWNTIRIQVKYRELSPRDGNIVVKYKSTVNGKDVPIDFDAIDGWAIFCPEINEVVYVNKSEINMDAKSFSFGLTPAQKSINSRIHTSFGSVAEW